MGELGRGKASPCTPDEEGAAKPRPYLCSPSVISTLYSELCSTFAPLHRPPADLHCCTVYTPVPGSPFR